ncbi:MAG: ATP-binding protein [Oscillospiraceae bacterium]|nr:ATP-binding protein [Oscillospiraceae bacterium]
MAYSNTVVRRARQRLESKKADRESVQQARLQEIYQKLPRVREIDRELRSSMVLAAQAAFLKGTDGQEALAQVKQANLALQDQRKALIAAAFPPVYLDESPICSHCGGSGYIGSAMCTCLLELCREEQKKELALLSAGEHTFDQFHVEYYPEQIDPKYGVTPRFIMTRTFEACRKYAAGFTADAGNLLFNGGTGLGKTFLSACIAREAAEKGYSVAYESAQHLFAKLEKNRFHPDEESAAEVAKFNDCDLLIVDDLGTELPGNFVTAALYALVNDRLLAGKPMIISTNLSINEIKERYSPQIASRLQGSFQLLPFVGEDIRVLKNK